MTHADRTSRSRTLTGELKQENGEQQADLYFVKEPLQWVILEPQAQTMEFVILHRVEITGVQVKCGERVSTAFQTTLSFILAYAGQRLTMMIN